MRAYIVLAVLLGGCSASMSDPDPRVAELEMEIAALRARLDLVGTSVGSRVATAEARIDALDLRPPKVPHLIHMSDDGIETDLGLWLFSSCVYSIPLQGELCFDQALALYFSDENCTGDVYTETPERISMHHVHPRNGRALRRGGIVGRTEIGSYQRPFSPCIEYPSGTTVDNLYPLVDTGVQTIGSLDVLSLHVALR